jgi:hypothetical protein
LFSRTFYEVLGTTDSVLAELGDPLKAIARELVMD